ncbi:MAG: WYL domain-containing protein [Actinomycetota bacterium]|nr:WYL domain-containing protein [Actinomycetota bacterium]
MTTRRPERLVNLVICLLATRHYLTAEQIRRAVPGYEADDGTDRAKEAFKRMFERDKAELREIGVPLETGRTSAFDDEDGYRITRNAYELPPISLAADEAAAVGLAARLWHSAALGGAAEGALHKLRAAGVSLDEHAAVPLEPRLDSGEPAFGACFAAATERRELRFDYQRPDGSDRTPRRIHPWGVVARRGRWYVCGYDLDRGAPRAFRLSRFAGRVKAVGPTGAFERPDDLDLVSMVASAGPASEVTARIRVRPDAAEGLRRVGKASADDVDLIEIPLSDLESLADRVTSFGAEAIVEEPDQLRDAVIGRLRRLAAMPSASVKNGPVGTGGAE